MNQPRSSRTRKRESSVKRTKSSLKQAHISTSSLKQAERIIPTKKRKNANVNPHNWLEDIRYES